MPPPPIPTFKHDDQAIHNFINMALTHEDTPSRAQIILMSGIYLNNLDLIRYAREIDNTVINRPVSNGIIEIIESILKPEGGHLVPDTPN